MAPTSQDDGSSSVASSPLQFFSMMSLPPNLGSPYPWLRELKSEERGLCLIHLLLTCANHVASGSLENANISLDQISHLASANGDTMQRIAAYFTEALADRILKSWPGIHKALNSTKISLVSENIHAHKLFFELCPFLKLAFLITNQAIIESMVEERMVHIIDLSPSEPAQWIALLQALSTRPEGPPHLRITGIHRHKEVLDHMAHKLTEEAEKLDVPFQFNPMVTKLENLDIEKLRVKTGEALAISSVLQLHSLLASDDEELLRKNNLSYGHGPNPNSSPSSSLPSPRMEGFLNALWGLSPKLMVVTEQDSSHNGSGLMERLLEALHFYASLFDCLELTMSRTSMDRLKVEKMLYGEEIKNIVSCEGKERQVRHEKLEKWVKRLDSAGFVSVPLSYYGTLQACRFLQGLGCDGYKVKEENGCVAIYWQDRSLFSVSSWRCRK